MLCYERTEDEGCDVGLYLIGRIFNNALLVTDIRLVDWPAFFKEGGQAMCQHLLLSTFEPLPDF
jgi:hypothetical protein